MKYFRFCADYVSPYTRERYGIFIAVWHLVRDKKISAEDEASYWQAREWFETHLPIPPYHQNGNPDKAITWFKESAMNSLVVQKLVIYRDIAARHGTEIELVSTDSPGRVIYEDEYQIATVSNQAD